MGGDTLGIYSNQYVGTGLSYAEDRPHPETRWLILSLILILLGSDLAAETIRVATYNVSLGRKGPGLLLRDIVKGDEQVAGVQTIIRHIRPDILLLNEFDNDFSNLALKDFLRGLSEGADGIEYPYFYAAAGNEGQPSFLDLDGDGRLHRWSDSFGFGKFPGSEGMVLLSRLPIDLDGAQNFSSISWLSMVGDAIPAPPEGLIASEALPLLRLSSKSHWDIPIILPNGERLHILASHPTPPVFDEIEDLNGLRNDAEIGFWVGYLDGMTDERFVLLGDFNNDPVDGEGRNGALHRLLSHNLVTDPEPQSTGAVQSAVRLSGANASQLGNPAFDTVEWDADIGNMRVDYVLPSANIPLLATGVYWPDTDDPMAKVIGEGREGASNHRLVWVDLEFTHQ